MKVYALVGPSGTGKSHRALLVAHKYNIPLIVDDGLLIKGNKILAGSSAKREASKIAAVRRAIFIHKDHSAEVRNVLDTLPDQKILILGTSINMVERILKELELSKIDQIVNIEDIATEEEIKIAQQKRLGEGKHVIPVPTIEVKPKFSGYLMESLELMFRIKDKPTSAEKTIVRPKFSYYGKLLIHDNVISQLINHGILSHSAITRTTRLDTVKTEEGLRISASIEAIYGYSLQTIGKEVQEQIKTIVESCTGLNILEVNLEFVMLRVLR